ncbi:MAG: hypothetical protein RSD28_07575 [Lachnospiraceae bacterium]
MIYQKIKDLFVSSVELISSDISNYSVNPNTDFQRNRNISPQTLISYLVSQGKRKPNAVNGSTYTYFSTPSFSSDDYYYTPWVGSMSIILSEVQP